MLGPVEVIEDADHADERQPQHHHQRRGPTLEEAPGGPQHASISVDSRPLTHVRSVGGRRSYLESGMAMSSARARNARPAMADPILLFVSELGHRLLPSLGHEDGVVAEAAFAAPPRHERAVAPAVGVDRSAVGIGEGCHAAILRRPSCAGDPFEGAHHELQVLLIRGVFARIPGAARAGPAPQRVDLDPRVVRDGRDAEGYGDGSRLEQRRCRGRSPRSPRRRGTRSGSWFSTVTHATGQSEQMRPSSRSLWALREAMATRSGNATNRSGSAAERFALQGREPFDARRPRAPEERSAGCG